ncbi:Predicted secretion system X pseudopilin PulG-like [hydrothermal vent metagenome]|uniref:Predicted secretion system X pseudopilin PulG-like n=1 Tax=hydrothermal vent metagenome TaxID=652676 RepID=A0A3B0YXZ6_9ZZZZ
MMLAAVAVLGITSGVAVQYQSKISHREKEKELLFRGQAIMKAVQSYYEAGKTVKLYPPTLDALLQDDRYVLKKHLRKLYIDPFTLKADWVVIKNQYGVGIFGVHSRSDKQPVKRANFPLGLESFEAASSYSDWHFVYQPTATIPLKNKNTLKK